MIKILQFVLQSLNCIKNQVLLQCGIRECSEELNTWQASSRELKYHYRQISGVNEASFAEC